VGSALSVVIVGAGVAGANAALELGRLAPDAHVTLIGSEPHLPYQRPPLSKGFLRGTEPFDAALVAPRSEYERLGVDLVLGRRVVKLEPEFKRIRLEGDEVVPYDRVLIATGGRKRRLPFPGSDREGVFDLRTVEDSERIQAAARAGRRVVVIGLGFIGCEVAASLRMLGLEVTAIDPAQAPLLRVLGPEVAGVITGLHQTRGVQLVLGDGVDRLEGGERVERVVTKSGRQFECDFVVAGIGIDPDVDLLRAAGARILNGVELTSIAGPACLTSMRRETSRTTLTHCLDAFESSTTTTPKSRDGRLRHRSWTGEGHTTTCTPFGATSLTAPSNTLVSPRNGTASRLRARFGIWIS